MKVAFRNSDLDTLQPSNFYKRHRLIPSPTVSLLVACNVFLGCSTRVYVSCEPLRHYQE